jgi:hypothetical protein
MAYASWKCQLSVGVSEVAGGDVVSGVRTHGIHMDDRQYNLQTAMQSGLAPGFFR